jgi:hypothetical protein
VTDTAKPTDAADLQAQIEDTREDLSRTVDLLAAKLDVKTRVRGRVLEARDDVQSRLRTAGDRARAGADQADARQVSIGAAALAAALTVLIVALWRRKQQSSRPRWRP